MGSDWGAQMGHGVGTTQAVDHFAQFSTLLFARARRWEEQKMMSMFSQDRLLANANGEVEGMLKSGRVRSMQCVGVGGDWTKFGNVSTHSLFLYI